MPKKGSRVEINTFIQGLITEASPLNFPANASLDEDNFELNRDGTRDRRLGMDFEPNFSLIDIAETTSSVSAAALNTFKWYSVNGLTSKEFLVAQVNRKIFFFDLERTVLSDEGYKGTVTLSSLPENVRYSFAALEGKLVVAAGTADIAVVAYDEILETFSASYSRLTTRDSWGVQVPSSNYETDVSFRGTSLPIEHRYNLQNQSWGIPRKNKAGTLVNPVTQYFTDLAVYPSNSEVVWTGLQYQPIVGAADPFERMYTNLYTEVLGSSLKAAKGYFVIDALARGTSRQAVYAANSTKYPALGTTTAALPDDTTPGGATCLTSFAGRVFYAGFSGAVEDGDSRSPVLSDHVMFSKLVRSPEDITKCYSDGDPTSRESNDLVDTDGGFIRISGANGIVSLQNIETHLLVFATNGVWSISGGSDFGFSATNYKVSRVSVFGSLSDSSVVREGGRIFYWAEDGIYVIAKNQYGELSVESLTKTTIQTLYENIPTASKTKAIGTYDMFTKKLRWIYKEGALFTPASVTRELIFDLSLNAFYTSTIKRAPGNVIEVMGVFPSAAFNTGSAFEPVFVGTDAVLVGTEQVGFSSDIRKSGIQSLRYLTFQSVGSDVNITFAYYQDSTFVDWYSLDNVGVDAKAFLVTGSQTAGDSAIEKQIPYLIMHFRRTEINVVDFIPERQSSCFARSQWNWADSAVSGKWSPLFQAYRYRQPRFVTGPNDDYDNGYETVVTKNKMRGRGKAFALYLETEAGKDCRILGWSLTLNANSTT